LRPEPLVVIAMGLLGLGLRLWVMTSDLGVLDADGAVPGLMALHILDGAHPVFYWGQAYGGSIESFLAAGLFAVLPDDPFVLKLVPVALSAVATVLVWRIGRRLLGARAGVVAAVLFWLAPISFMWWTTKIGTYWAALCLALSAVLLVLRLADRERWPWWEVAGLGVVVGLGWWANPQTVYLLAPVALANIRRFLSQWRHLPLLAASALVGAAPWLVYNLGHDWASLSVEANTTVPNGYFDHVRAFFRVALPMALWLREPYTLEWVLGPVGQVAYVALLLGFVLAAVRWRRARLLVVMAAAYPFLFAISPLSYYVEHPRYLLFVFPTICLLAGGALAAGRALTAGGVAVVAVLCLVGTISFPAAYVWPQAPTARVPADSAPLLAVLRERQVRYAYAHYWIAYRVTFETGERTIVAPVGGTVREPHQVELVRRQPAPAFIFIAPSPELRSFLAGASERGVPVRVDRRGGWALVRPASALLPEQVPAAFPP
jgi:4-amino-4-deoxy-L-arabinose transferase-like glycosyltransferase